MFKKIEVNNIFLAIISSIPLYLTPFVNSTKRNSSSPPPPPINEKQISVYEGNGFTEPLIRLAGTTAIILRRNI